ncbi:hypothetical protein, partial [Chromohalobacter sp. 48-RD10]|uniref:hypothetical protein n=1 Tax=Chromohalobacter sp. 48-RD10 TaxID=2994063 RepID=UPI0024688DD7
VNRISQIGFYSLGLEYDSNLVDKARLSAHKNARFEVAEVSPQYIQKMEHHDAILLLSVMHRIWALNGKEYAESCLTELSKKTENIYFEGSVGLQRYQGERKELPSFENNAIEKAVEWHRKWLKKHLTNGTWDVEYLGVVPHTSSEPYRILFSAKKLKNKEPSTFSLIDFSPIDVRGRMIEKVNANPSSLLESFVFHIGLHRTGTTTLQEDFFSPIP